ncbi:hypothetical protein WH87_16755 [Devosia epidermidihirudinis]|uniref:Solute-binding protein family 5 domain-containing protein n=1 Tax=Devosia epidermidihirudinis TaxID=1293439 RepID=A0A0F5Q3Q0_9HYPH|nr:peptide ABC transporter substrate-binding protein [Devosia epidermidihirudinis]KKC35251.1 hypothetical protein WH87_16755 [Devosia epidermidihirudinis]
MNFMLKVGGALALAAVLTAPALAQSRLVAPGLSTTGTYMDYMRTVYARAAGADLVQVPLSGFDKNYELTALAAESWEQSEDGLTWTFKLRDGLVWSDGEPLKASDYIFSLQQAATSGYDFAWYWDTAASIANWKEVTDGTADVSTLGIKAVDDHTITVTTVTPKPYLPSVVSLWYPTPKHQFDKVGEDWSTNVDTIVASGPFKVQSWEKSNNTVVLEKNESYTGPWQAQVDEVEIDSSLGLPEVGLPAFLAGEADISNLNAGQIPVMRQRMPDNLRQDAVFAVSYISFDLDSPPFDNVDVRRAFYYAVNRDELTSTVLRDLAAPAGSILAPGYPGYNAEMAAKAVFDPQKAKDFMTAAGYPDGKGFPEVEIWFREEGGANGAILPPTAQYLQAQFKEILGITMNIKIMPGKDWMEGLLARKNNLYIAPYGYDYLDPSNFFGIFYNGGRHNYHVAEYDALVAQADSNPVWEERLKLYAQAEQVMIDQGMIVPLVHPLTTSVISDAIGGDATVPNENGYTPFGAFSYMYTHITKN